MKRILYGLLLVAHIANSQTPLPPISSNAKWEVDVTTQLGVNTDIFTYGLMYERCGYMYRAVLRNNSEEVLYLRQTEDQSFYLLDVNDCESEKILYDYSGNIDISIPVRTELSFPDSFQFASINVLDQFTDDILGNEVKQVNLSYESGTTTFQTPSFWFRGIGDYIHPFFPIFNSFDPDGAVTYSLQSLHVNNMPWYCTSPSACSASNIIYVNKDVLTGNQDGSSWGDAYSSLSTALNSADFGDVLWVAEGTYNLPTSADRYESFVLRDGISIYGGFTGTEMFFNDRNPSVNITTLSGDIGMPNNISDNTFHVVRIQDVDAYAVLDGVNIEEGNAFGGNIAFPFSQNGGAVIIYKGLPSIDTADIIINDCNLLNNSARLGGAITFNNTYSGQTTLYITNTLFNDNFADNGGGAIYLPQLSTSILCHIDSSTFDNNRVSAGSGGAIHDINNLTNWTCNRSAFTNNRIEFGDGGAISLWNENSTRIIQFLATDFSNNFCSTDGGAISYIHDVGTTSLDATFTSCRFQQNTGQTGAGGAISIGSFETFDLGLTISNCEFNGNFSANLGGALHILSNGAGEDGFINVNQSTFLNNRGFSNIGGAVRVGIRTPNDQIITNKRYYMEFENCLFARNKGAYSQGNATNETSIVGIFSNCTFYKNGLLPLTKNYSANFNDSTWTNRLDIRNSILWEEGIPVEQILYNGNPSDWNINNYNLDHCLISVDHCDVPGGENACEINTNYFNIDPLFRDTMTNDFRLHSCSPLINAGVFYDAPFEDIAGNDRIQEGQIDLGAYETSSYQIRVDTLMGYVECFGDSTGRIVLSSLNANQPVSYELFNNIDGTLVASNNMGIFNNISEGDYHLISTDNVGCSDTISIEIYEPMPLALDISSTNYFSEQEAGSISIDSISGGTQPYTLLLDNTPASNLLIEGLIPGTYLVSVQDSLGCSQDTLVEILLINPIDEIVDLSNELKLNPNLVSPSSSVYLSMRPETIAKSQILIVMLNGSGQVIDERSFSSSRLPFTLKAPMIPGTYFLTIRIVRNGSIDSFGVQKLVVVDY
ncbi:MAG: choice-of-anchor Q domain-containing protein [Bacteroidota bacterium]